MATGARFEIVESIARLPNAANFAPERAGFGISVQLWTGDRVVVLGVPNATIAGSYSAAVAVFNRTTHALHQASQQTRGRGRAAGTRPG